MAVGVHTDMSSPHLYWTGSEALKEKYLPAICRGDAPGAIAVTEPGGGSDVAAIQTRAVRDGDHYVLNGAKMFITNGVLADLYFVAARIDSGPDGKRHRGISMFLVERHDAGLQRQPQARQDGQSRVGHRRAGLPGHAGARGAPAWPIEGRASTR